MSSGCGARTLPGEEAWITMNGTHVSLSYLSGSTPCRGTLPYLDACAEAVATDLGLPVPRAIAYHYTQDLPCPADALGCAVYQPGAPVSCWSQKPGTVHELVHAVQMDRTGDGPRFLLEGEAVALGETSYASPLVATPDSELLKPGPLPGTDYALAGDLVSYLLTRFGAAPFEQVLSALRADSPADELQARFAAAYGETMTQLRADRAASTTAFLGARLDLPECLAMLPDPQIVQGQAVSESLDCSTNAVGTVGGDLSRAVPFDIAANGLYEFDLRAPSGAVIDVTECGGGPSLSYATSGRDLKGPAFIVGYLARGRYFFLLHGPWSDPPSAFSVSVRPLSLTTDPACTAMAPIDVPLGTQRVYLFSMSERTIEVPYLLEGQVTFAGGFVGFGSSGEVCSGGCGVGCTPIIGSSSPLAPGATFTLRARLAGTTMLVGEFLR